MSDSTTVEHYLSMMVERIGKTRPDASTVNGYVCLEDFVKRNGRSMTPAALPKGIRRGRMKDCFRNAGLLALTRADLTYCEGYATGIITVLHGWCVDADNRVVDPTWPEGTEYFGVPISERYLRWSVKKFKVWGCIDLWLEDWPILRAAPEDWRA